MVWVLTIVNNYDESSSSEIFIFEQKVNAQKHLKQYLFNYIYYKNDEERINKFIYHLYKNMNAYGFLQPLRDRLIDNNLEDYDEESDEYPSIPLSIREYGMMEKFFYEECSFNEYYVEYCEGESIANIWTWTIEEKDVTKVPEDQKFILDMNDS
jgi:hypothetical protein